MIKLLLFGILTTAIFSGEAAANWLEKARTTYWEHDYEKNFHSGLHYDYGLIHYLCDHAVIRSELREYRGC